MSTPVLIVTGDKGDVTGQGVTDIAVSCPQPCLVSCNTRELQETSALLNTYQEHAFVSLHRAGPRPRPKPRIFTRAHPDKGAVSPSHPHHLNARLNVMLLLN